MMKILLAGACGQLGRELSTSLAEMGQVTSVDKVAGETGSIELDLSCTEEVEALLNRLQPDVVVNAAAYTAVDPAEEDARVAFRLNAELPACLARWCKNHDALLMHYSTDYIFNGKSDRPYREDDLPSPLSVYGESKLSGEWAIQASQCRHAILRTSWVYSSHGNNFALSMLRLARQKSELSIVSDQTGCPTLASNLAAVSAAVLKRIMSDPADRSLLGIFHYCDKGVVSWYDFAELIFERAEKLGLLHEKPRLKSIRSTEYPQAASRPKYSVLDTHLIQKLFDIEPREIGDSLDRCLEKLSP